MKKKSIITITSIFLNVVLFSALAYYNKVNSHAATAPAPFFRLQHLPEVVCSQIESRGIALASNVK